MTETPLLGHPAYGEPRVRRERKTFVGSDVLLVSPDGKPFDLPPGHGSEFTVPFPVDYFLHYQGHLETKYAAQFSTRSVLQQAGTCVIGARPDEESGLVYFYIRNGNPNTVLHFPPRLPLGRFYIKGSILPGNDLVELLPLLFLDNEIPHGALVAPDGLSIHLPIVRFARITKPSIDLSVLRNNRQELDSILGFKWESEFAAKFDELVIGETPPIMVPSDVHGDIVVGVSDDKKYAHQQSPFVDPRFGLSSLGIPLRTEFWHMTDDPTPASHVDIQFF